ncbi:MAG: hypothetical protein Q4C70_09460, partial [Planctomycetia bacterium]|nr:hypothetical protein [Planctomycetia bacterium]
MRILSSLKLGLFGVLVVNAIFAQNMIFAEEAPSPKNPVSAEKVLYPENPALTEARIARNGDFFVAKNGNDTWSGTLAEPNENGTDGPFATLDRAKTAVREAVKAV